MNSRCYKMIKSFNILLVEDNPAEVQLAELALKENGDLDYSLNVAIDGESALRYLRAKPVLEVQWLPDLVLLDLNLPMMSGKDVLHEIKSDDVLMHIPTIIMSSSSSPE